MYEKTTRSRKFDRRCGSTTLALGLLIALATLAMTILAMAQTPPVSVSKTASPDQAPTGSITQYAVIFSNSSANPVDLNTLADTLPPGFSFVSMGPGDIIDNPSGSTGTIVWTGGPYTVPASGTLTMQYNVLIEAPASAVPYSNHVEAELSTGETIFAKATVLVLGPHLSGSKTPSVTTIPDRAPLDYTVSLTNDGSADATIGVITDTLPAAFRFLQMVSGPLPEPIQQGNNLIWTGPFSLPMGDSLVFTYRVKADGTAGHLHANSVWAAYDGLVAGPYQASVMVTINLTRAFLPIVTKYPTPPPINYKLAYESKPGDNYEIYSIEYDGTDLFNISNLSGGDMDPDWSPGGTQIAWVHYGGNAEIYVANADGTGAHNVSNHAGDDRDPEWSPDGSQILFRSDRDDRWDIFVMNADGSNQRKLTGARSCQSTEAKWSPSGAKIGFICGLDKQAELFMMNPDGTSTVRLTDDTDEDRALNWSPDNTRIVYVRVPDDDDSEIWVVDVNSVTRTRLTTNEVDDFAPMFSPDGTKIVLAHEYSDSEITVMNADGSGMVNLSNSPGGDFLPQWSPDGTLIAFISNRDGNKELYVMHADGSNQFRLTSTSTDESSFDWWPVTP